MRRVAESVREGFVIICQFALHAVTVGKRSKRPERVTVIHHALLTMHGQVAKLTFHPRLRPACSFPPRIVHHKEPHPCFAVLLPSCVSCRSSPLWCGCRS